MMQGIGKRRGWLFVDHLFDYVTLLSGKQQGTENKFRTCVLRPFSEV